MKIRRFFSVLSLSLLLITSLAGCQRETAPTGEEQTADGVYTPAVFRVSGGSGRVTITCERVAVQKEKVRAHLVFSSPHYTQVKVGNQIFYRQESAASKEKAEVGEKVEEGGEDTTSSFDVPAKLNQEFEIKATTTAMSRPYEITYRLFLKLKGSESDPLKGSGSDSSLPEGQTGRSGEKATGAGSGTAKSYDSSFDAKKLTGLTFLKKEALSYAKGFSIYTYQGGYRLIDVRNSARYLFVPDQKEEPKDLPAHLVVIHQPHRIYLAATATMSLFDKVQALSCVRMTGTDVSGWSIRAPKKALQDGRMLYAGKYSAPDYELLTKEGCDLAVESTMISHTPEVTEMLTSLGIPVFVDRSSYEAHPLGRTEWIKVYGVLTGHEQEAEAFFEEQKKKVESLGSNPATGKTVAFFSVSADGKIQVRRGSDYIAKMIALAGGTYLFNDLEGEGAGAQITMEEFYKRAADADYLIYNGAIEGMLGGMDDLLKKSELFSDFKAVQEGKVWQTGKSLYQEADIVGEMTVDLHKMLEGRPEGEMRFLKKVD
ncbi:MAG: ABC transporter substrate-binding protein [Lachnospiraceae bacterium]|nr:ABC transporter substrate-binding protein [Lachnospiraceae bacterium]